MLATSACSAVPDPSRLLSVTAVPGERSGRVVVQVTGVVDAYTAPLLRLCLDSQSTQRGLQELVVDLEQVTALTADGVTVLGGAHRRCRMRGSRLVICPGGWRHLLRSLMLTGLADAVAVDPAQVERPPTKGRRTTTSETTGRRPGPLQLPAEHCPPAWLSSTVQPVGGGPRSPEVR